MEFSTVVWLIVPPLKKSLRIKLPEQLFSNILKTGGDNLPERTREDDR